MLGVVFRDGDIEVGITCLMVTGCVPPKDQYRHVDECMDTQNGMRACTRTHAPELTSLTHELRC